MANQTIAQKQEILISTIKANKALLESVGSIYAHYTSNSKFRTHAEIDALMEDVGCSITKAIMDKKADLPKTAKAEQTKKGEATMAPKKKTTKKAPKVTLAELQAAAEDFNSFMEFEEPEGIPFDDMDEEELIEEITETAEELESSDQILQTTADTLTKMGVEFEATVDEDEDEDEDEEEEESEVTEEEVGKMKLAELKTLAEELEIDLGKAKTVKAVRAVILEELFPEDDEDEVEEEEVEEEEVEEDEVEEVVAVPLKGAEAKAIKAKIAEVAKLKKLDDIKAIAKDSGVRIPPPFLKDLKKLKTYVTGKLEAILSGDFVPGAPKVKKDKKSKKASGPSITGMITEIICNNFDITSAEIMEELDKKEVTYSPSTVSTTLGGVTKVLNCLKKLKKVK